ncbi:MAG: F420-dependent methylenetetrahydromethanopterin dehydrogenase [Candidatus Helarchaeota archaeon]
MVFKLGVIKCGNIGCSPVLELLFDERADRENIDCIVIGSGAKLNEAECVRSTKLMVEQKPDLIFFTSPNAGLPGPSKAREILAESGIPSIIVTDAPGKKAVEDCEAKGIGYFIVTNDSMIGARRPFLDPTEMAIFNSEILGVLAMTGVLRLIVNETEKVITQILNGEKPELPKVIIKKNNAIEAAGYSNPYAKNKAIAAFEISKSVAAINVEGCFKTKGRENYMPIVGAGHEVLTAALKLAREAREIEKSNDTVLREPHDTDGTLLTKTKFIVKPEKK